MSEQTPAPQGKGRPTPSRKQAQARNARPLVGSKDPAAKRAAREQAAARREEVRRAVAAGDERYLTPRDKGPQRRFIRDWVDARRGVGEFTLPIMFAIVIWTFIPTQWAYTGAIVMWALVLVIVVDSTVMSIFLKRLLKQKFGADKIERGWRFYAISRSIQMRILRLPKPQVKRGQFPV